MYNSARRDLAHMSIDRTLKPEILTHPNIPKPLHGLNPRLIMGKKKWDTIREEAYRSSDYHCIACGVHQSEAKKKQQLEAHEYYSMDYSKGHIEITSIEPLCHYCHVFIHSGLLSVSVTKGWRTKQEAVEILEHGFKILSDNNLQCFPYTWILARRSGAETYGVEMYQINAKKMPKWADWRLAWDGQEYAPKFDTPEKWKKNYN
jgi:hypothetical protein